MVEVLKVGVKMGRLSHKKELNVYMNGDLVGYLQQKMNGSLSFTYSESWLAWQYARPISLSMPLTNKVYTGDLVYNFFDNLLPDSRLIRDRIQQRFATKTNRSFDLLYHIGADCVGALQLISQPLEKAIIPATKKLLNDQSIAQILTHYRTAPLGMQDDSDFRISIAGAQEKTALLKINNKWYLPSGTIPTTHILKLPIGHIEHSGIDLTDSVENEWLCMNILKEFGLPTANVEICKFANVKVLVVERFDRVWNKDQSELIRIPQEDMCQALAISSGLKYESDGGPGIGQIMNVLQGSINAIQDRRNFMRAVFIYWVLGAIDGHAKNFSIILEPGGSYKLAPLYDVISAYPLTAKRQLELKKIKMAMAVNGKNKHYKWSEIQPEHWISTAKICKFSEINMLEIINETFDLLDQVVENVTKKLPKHFPIELADAVFLQMLALRNKYQNNFSV